jgi:hypothetical protein
LNQSPTQFIDIKFFYRHHTSPTRRELDSENLGVLGVLGA